MRVVVIMFLAVLVGCAPQQPRETPSIDELRKSYSPWQTEPSDIKKTDDLARNYVFSVLNDEAMARHGFKTEVLSLNSSELGGMKEAIVNITGEEVYLHFRFEAGGHRVQRVPKTESQGRIHTSAATVAVLLEPEEVEIDIDWDKDVLEHVSRSGGPGGQNVNKVSSAIRLEHLSSGITVSMRDEKSQHKNRAKARRILMSRLFEHHQREQDRQIASDRKSMVGSGDRSERIRTYNFPQNRCTDHRINKDVYDLEGILVGGNLDEFLSALHERDLKLRLEKL